MLTSINTSVKESESHDAMQSPLHENFTCLPVGKDGSSCFHVTLHVFDCYRLS